MKYPNLGLLDYIFQEKVNEKYEIYKKAAIKEVEADVFVQTWASTALGFDTGNMFSGQAITKEYTTVFTLTAYLRKNNKKPETAEERRAYCSPDNISREPVVIHGVFFGDTLAYIVDGDIKGRFYEDLKNRQMLSVSKAKEAY